MSYEIRLIDLAGGEKHLAGRVLGAELFAREIEPVLATLGDRSVLLLSFRGVAFVTGSILKATWHEALRKEICPVMVAHLANDVRDEFGIYLESQRMAGLEAEDWGESGVTLATLRGDLEEPARRALQAICDSPGSTAPELQRMSDEKVSATAWTNRLNELHRNGLAFREKAGRAWRFFPTATEVRHG